MRPDMGKVIKEGARKGSSNPGLKTGLRIRDCGDFDDSDLPARLPSFLSRHQRNGSKDSSENWNPLRRFLQKNINQPWNRVYAEICASIDRRSKEGQSVFEILGHLTEGKFSEFFVDTQDLLQKRPRLRYRNKKPTIIRIEFLSSVEIVFKGQIADYFKNWVVVKKVKLNSPSFLFSRRYNQVVVEKKTAGWIVEYRDFYDPEEVIYKKETSTGIVLQRRKDLSGLPTTFIIKTKTPNRKELKEINRLLSLTEPKEKEQPAA